MCTLRSEAEGRIKQTRQYLKKHPKGFPGISKKELNQGLDGPKRTVKALKGLNCPKQTTR